MLELPTWMLDRVACAPMRMDAHPRVGVAALDALTTLLAEVAIAGAASSNTLVAKAQMVSRDENRGDRDASARCVKIIDPGRHNSICSRRPAPRRCRRRGGAPFRRRLAGL